MRCMKKLIDLNVGDKAWYVCNEEDYTPRRITITRIAYTDNSTSITFSHDWNVDRESTVHISNTWLESKSSFDVSFYNTMYSDSACMINKFRQKKKKRVAEYYSQLEYYQDDVSPSGYQRECIEKLSKLILEHEHRYREMLKEVRRIEKG